MLLLGGGVTELRVAPPTPTTVRLGVREQIVGDKVVTVQEKKRGSEGRLLRLCTKVISVLCYSFCREGSGKEQGLTPNTTLSLSGKGQTDITDHIHLSVWGGALWSSPPPLPQGNSLH